MRNTFNKKKKKKKEIIREKKKNGSSYFICFARWKRNPTRKNWANTKRKTRHTEEDYLEHNMCIYSSDKRDPG